MKKFLSLILALMVVASSAIFTVGATDVSTAYLDGETFFYSFENESDFSHPGMKLDDQGTDNFQDPDIANYTTPGAGGSNGAVGIHVETAVSNGNTGSGIVGIQMYPGKEYELTFKIKLFSTENLKAAPKMGIFFMTSNAEIFTDAACTQSEGIVNNRYQYTTHDLGTVIPVENGVVSDGWHTYSTKVSIGNKFSSGYVPMDKPVNLNMFLRIGGVNALDDTSIYTDEFLASCGTHTYNDKERKSLWLEYALDDIGMRPASHGEKKDDVAFSFDAANTSDGKVYAITGNEYAGGLTDKGNNKSWINTNVKLTYNLPADVEPGNYALSFDYLSAYTLGSNPARWTALQIFVDGKAVTGIIDLDPTANDWNRSMQFAEYYDSYIKDDILIPITKDAKTLTIQAHNGSSLTNAGHSHAMAAQFAVKTENSFTFTKISDIVEPVEFSFNAANTTDGKVYAIGGWENTSGLVDQGSNKSRINENVKLTYNLPEDMKSGNYALSFDYLSAYPSSSTSTKHPYIQIFVDGIAVTDIIDLDRTASDWNSNITTAEPYDSYTDDEVLIPITADSETVMIQVHNASSLTTAGVASPVPSGFALTTSDSFTFTKVSDIVEPVEFSFDAADTSDGKVYAIGGWENADGLSDQGSNKSKVNANVKLTYNLSENVEAGNYALSFDYLTAYPSSSTSMNHPYIQIFVDSIAVTDVIELNRTAKDWNNAITTAEPYNSYTDDEILIPITADSETVMIQVHNTSSLTTAGVTSPVPSGFAVTTENSFIFTKVSDIPGPVEFAFDAADTSDGKVYDGAGKIEYAAGLTDKGNNLSRINANVRLTYNLPENTKSGNYSLAFDYLSAYPSSADPARWTALQIYVDGKAVTGIIDLTPTAKDWNGVITNAEHYDSYEDDEVLIPITNNAKTVSIQAHNGSSLTAAGHSHSMAAQFAVKTENSFTFTKVSDLDIKVPAEFTVRNIYVTSTNGNNILYTGDTFNVTWYFVNTNKVETQEANGGSLVKVYQVNGNEKALIGTAKAEEAGCATLTATPGLFGKDLAVEVLPLDVNGNYGIAASVETDIKVALAVDTSFKLSVGNSVDFSASIKSDEITGSANVYVAAYDSGDKLLDVALTPLNYQSGDNSVSGNFAFTDDAVTLKLFLWDSITYAPIIEEKVIELKEVVSDPFAGDDTINVVYLGDSLYAGTGASETSKRWVNQVGEWYTDTFGSEKTVNNYYMGKGGTTTEYSVARLYRDVIAYDPDVVYVSHTCNDGSRDTRRNMETIVRTLMNLENPPYIIFTRFTNRNLSESNGYGNQVAEHYGLPLIDDREAYVRALVANGNTMADYFIADGVHPNDSGYDVIANEVIARMETGRYWYRPTEPATKLLENTGNITSMTSFSSQDASVIASGFSTCTGDGNKAGMKSTAVGDTLSFTFTGNVLAFEYGLNEAASKIEIWVDDELKMTCDPYYNGQTGNKLVGNEGSLLLDLESGTHNVVMKTVTGRNTSVATPQTVIYDIFTGTWEK